MTQYPTLKAAKSEARARSNIDGEVRVIVEYAGEYTILLEDGEHCQPAVAVIYPDEEQ